MCVMFTIFRNMAISVLLGTLFISKCIQGIFRSEMKIVSFIFSLLSVLMVHKTEFGKTEEQ